MTPATEQALLDSITAHEGNKLKVYDDATGKPIVPGMLVQGIPTIGRGRNLMDPGITPAESDYLYNNDRDTVCRELDTMLPWWRQLADARQLVMVELGFNLGVTHLVQSWPKTVEYVRTGQYFAASVEMLGNRVWVGQVKPARANALAQMMSTGVLT